MTASSSLLIFRACRMARANPAMAGRSSRPAMSVPAGIACQRYDRQPAASASPKLIAGSFGNATNGQRFSSNPAASPGHKARNDLRQAKRPQQPPCGLACAR